MKLFSKEDGETLLLSHQKLWTQEDIGILSPSMCDSKHATHIFLKTFIQLAQMQVPTHLQTKSVNWLAVSTSFDTLIAADLERDPEVPKPDLESILEGDADTQPLLDKITAYAERLDATHAASPPGHAFFNGKHLEMGDVCSFLYFSLTVEFKTNRGRFMGRTLFDNFKSKSTSKWLSCKRK